MQAREPLARCHHHAAILVDRRGSRDALRILDHHRILALRERAVCHGRLVDAIEVCGMRDGIAHTGPTRLTGDLHANEDCPDGHWREVKGECIAT